MIRTPQSEKLMTVDELQTLARAVLNNSPFGRRDDELLLLAREVIECNRFAQRETADAIQLCRERDAALALASELVAAGRSGDAGVLARALLAAISRAGALQRELDALRSDK